MSEVVEAVKQRVLQPLGTSPEADEEGAEEDEEGADTELDDAGQEAGEEEDASIRHLPLSQGVEDTIIEDAEPVEEQTDSTMRPGESETTCAAPERCAQELSPQDPQAAAVQAAVGGAR